MYKSSVANLGVTFNFVVVSNTQRIQKIYVGNNLFTKKNSNSNNNSNNNNNFQGTNNYKH